MPGLRRTGEPRHVHQASMADTLAPAQRDEPLGDEGAIEPISGTTSATVPSATSSSSAGDPAPDAPRSRSRACAARD